MPFFLQKKKKSRQEEVREMSNERGKGRISRVLNACSALRSGGLIAS